MTDYYPVIARCVADLEPNPAARSEFYWLARTELDVQRAEKWNNRNMLARNSLFLDNRE